MKRTSCQCCLRTTSGSDELIDGAEEHSMLLEDEELELSVLRQESGSHDCEIAGFA